MYKKTISIEAQLKKIVDNNPEYAELWSTWNLNKKTLEPILNAIIKDYPHYSFHDNSHSESILLNIEKALGNENIEKLSPTDLWLLLHVAYLHDFGMVILDTKIHEFWKTSDFQEYLKEQQNSDDEEFKKAANLILSSNKNNEEFNNLWALDIKEAVTLLTSKYCRWQHGDFSRSYILDINNVWGIDIGHNGLIKKRLVSLIADISAMHTKPFEDLYTLHKKANGFHGDYVHPRLIASLLRLGDVLDLDNGRFNYCGEKIFGKMPSDSKVHYGKHESTKHVLISNELIEVEADCPTDDIYRETRRWYDTLKNEIEMMHLNWSDIATSEFTHPPKLASYKILRNGIEDSNELANLKFTISQSKAFEILEGCSIYKDKFSCIREIVQNAEDATKIQLWRDIKSGMYYSNKNNGINKSKVESGTLLPSDIPKWIYDIYSIQISVERNEENNAIVSVIDYGTGISLDSLKSICNVGQSYFQKKDRKQEIEEMPVWLRPTASFGVGLQSCFMLTDKIEIYTNSNKDGSYKMIFKSGKQEGYVNVEPLKESLARGSKVVLEIENALNFSYNMFGFTAKNFMRIDSFETNCEIIYKIIESIFQECDSSFFGINVKSESIKISEYISANMSNDEFPNENIGKDYLYSLSENKDSIRCWYHNNLYQITLNKNFNGDVKVKFKGKNVEKSKINASVYNGFRIEVDIYGIETKKALSLNREQLSLDAVKEVCEEIDFIIGQYFDLLLNDTESIKNNTELLDSILLTAWRFEKQFPENLYRGVSEQKNIKSLIYDESKKEYSLEKCSLYDIASSFPKVFFINQEIDDKYFIEGYSLTEEKLIKILNECNFEKQVYRRIIIDNKLKEFLSRTHRDIFFLKGNENIQIYEVRLDNELYSPDDYTKKQLIQRLVYRNSGINYGNSMNIMRRSIPAFQDYSKLAVEFKKIYFLGVEGKSKWNIISPISLDDFEKIKDFSKASFVKFVMDKQVFENLVNYVFEYAKIKSSKDDIVREYKRLIEEFYDIVE